MIRAFAFIATRSFINRIVFRFKKLKQPRYLISAIAAVAYFYFAVFRSNRGRRPFPDTMQELGFDIMAIAIAGLIVLAWSFPNHQALEFSEAEIHFLFTGPVTRQQALLYKLLRAQPTILVSVIMMSLIRIPNGRVIGLWAFMTTAAIYLTFVALVRARLHLAGVPGWVMTVASFGVFGGLGYAMSQNMTSNLERGSPFDTPVSRAILWIPRHVAEMLVSKDITAILPVAAAVVGTGAILFLIGSSLRVPLEESVLNASAVMSERRLRVRARRSGQTLTIRRIKPLFALPEHASPEMAIVWKHMTASVRMTTVWVAAIGTLYGLILFFGLVTPDYFADTAFGMSFFLTLWFPLAGSALFSQDLRLDYRNFDILRTFPIAGDRLVASAMLAPLALISVVQLVFIIGTTILAHVASGKAGFLGRPEFVVLALLFAIPVCASQLVVRNSIPILFPAWAGQSKEDMRGFVAIGQRIVALLLNLVVLFIMLLPAAIVAAGGYWLAMRVFKGGPAVLALTTMPAVALLIAENWLFVTFLGAQFDKLDATSDVDPAAA